MPADEGELRRIHSTPEVARWWGAPAAGFPWEEPEATRFTIVLDGVLAGLIQYVEEREPRYRHAGIDLFVDPALHGRGVGTEAVRRVLALLIEERGHHRITIDPACANAAAIRTYEKVGFRVVGVMRQYERDAHGPEWHDGLLMELLASERPVDRVVSAGGDGGGGCGGCGGDGGGDGDPSAAAGRVESHD